MSHFSKKNADENNLDPISYLTGDWNHPITRAGKFDLIIGSDLLYEASFSGILSRFINCHLTTDGVVILIDPGRRTARKIKESMNAYGFSNETSKINAEGQQQKGGCFTKYTFRRMAVD